VVVGGFHTFPSNIAFEHQTSGGTMMLVSGRYFQVMGLAPLIGRLTSAEAELVTAAGPPRATETTR